ncbi:MAG: hypothetical protein R3D55_21480 [Chloroflexota bacterium]
MLWPALIVEELDATQGNPDADLASDAPAVGNTAAPLQFRPAVADAGLTVNAIPSTDTGVALQLGIGLLLAYVVLSTAAGARRPCVYPPHHPATRRARPRAPQQLACASTSKKWAGTM